MPEAEEVHLWRVALPDDVGGTEHLMAGLAADEQERATSFLVGLPRSRFVAARASLRAILAGYLSIDPHEVRLTTHACTACGGMHGKPKLASQPGGFDLRFNLAHSGGRALVAVTAAREVGVDLELVEPITLADVAASLSPREHSTLAALAPSGREHAFYACWTRKEACLKARGDGLNVDPSRVELSPAPGDSHLLWAFDDPDASRRWTVRDVAAGDGYAAALAVEGALTDLHVYEYSPVKRID
jgi:4'-phosphopantetheinyl transferase